MVTKRGDHEDDEKAEDEQDQPPATQP
jgi:sec-independent protein translocase protein TatC